MSNPKNQKYIVDSWLDDPQFKDWLVKDKQNTRAWCCVCHKVIELSSGGKSALTDHGKGQKQKCFVKITEIFYAKKFYIL